MRDLPAALHFHSTAIIEAQGLPKPMF